MKFFCLILLISTLQAANQLEQQQFPLTATNLGSLQRADPLDCDEFIALAMDEEQYEGDASVTMPERVSQRELLLKQANASYQKGIAASTILEREQAFNQALSLYAAEASKIPAPSGQLYQALANSYFQLGEYSWSILYNLKALKLDPRNQTILDHIRTARSRLGLERQFEPFSPWQKLLLQSLVPAGMIYNILFLLSLAAFISLSLLIWLRHPILKKLSFVLCTFIILLLFNLMLSFYFSPIEGVLVTSTGYYREPDIQKAQLTTLPLKAGTTLRILTAEQQGSWLKTADNHGLIGYIPASAIRII